MDNTLYEVWELGTPMPPGLPNAIVSKLNQRNSMTSGRLSSTGLSEQEKNPAHDVLALALPKRLA